MIAIIQARMGSTRLPGKVLMNLCGEPILYHIIERAKQIKHIDQVLVATSERTEDNSIFDFCQSVDTNCFRGSEDDVLSRYFYAAQACHMAPDDIVIRLTADNPLVDPQVVDKLLMYFEQHNCAYASTSGFPLGLGAEAFTFSQLKEAFEKASRPSEREHVTPYMYRDGCLIGKLISPKDYTHFRFTMDTLEDYAFIEKIYNILYQGSHDFYLNDIIDVLERDPSIAEINCHIRQKGVTD